MQLLYTILALTALLTQTSAKLHEIDVGKYGLHYNASTIFARVGDKIQFDFYNEHSVAQSSFSSPCKPLAGGFYSGIVPSCRGCGPAPQHFILTINETSTKWFYCTIRGHCQAGMVGVINPLIHQTIQDYIAEAAKTDPKAPMNVTSPKTSPIGGVLVNITANSSYPNASQIILPSGTSMPAVHGAVALNSSSKVKRLREYFVGAAA